MSKLGIPVAEIAIDGQYSVKENMQYTNGLGSEDLITFTLCLRFKVEFLRPEHTTILSYSTFNSDNAFGTYLWLQSGSTLNLGFCKYWDDLVTGHCNYSPLKSIKIHDQWHHACWLVDTNGVKSDQIKVTAKSFFDGNKMHQG